MAEQKHAKATNLIPRPIQRACYAGLSAGGFSFVFGVPAEYTPRVIVAGACYSLFLSWHDLGRKPRKRGRQILLNHSRGSTPIDLEYSVQSGYIARETWQDTLNRWIFGRKEAMPHVKSNATVPRPAELDEFIFVSQGIQLREVHIKLFLKSAWRNRQYGKGLSARRWIRDFSQRPAWYKELSPSWFYAMRQLLFDCQASLKLQMIITESNQWLMLANEPHMTLRLLKWYESEKRK